MKLTKKQKKQLLEKVRSIKALEAQKKEIESEIDSFKDDIENLGRHISKEYNGKFVNGVFVCMKEGHSLDEVISEESQNIMNQQNDENEDQDESFGIQMM